MPVSVCDFSPTVKEMTGNDIFQIAVQKVQQCVYEYRQAVWRTCCEMVGLLLGHHFEVSPPKHIFQLHACLVSGAGYASKDR